LRRVRLAALVAVYLLATLFAFGSALSILFELQGFPTGRDSPRKWYVALQVLALTACAAAPLVATRVLARDRSRTPAVIYLAAVVLVAAVMGIRVG